MRIQDSLYKNTWIPVFTEMTDKEHMQYLTKTEKQTLVLGKRLGRALRGGEVIALSGNLGAGKTVFTKGLAEGLGVKKIITSPTFVLMNVYKVKNQESGIRNLVHIDCYRLKTAEDLKNIGAAEYFGQPDTVTVVEWAEKVKAILPRQIIKIKIQFKPTGRKITIT